MEQIKCYKHNEAVYQATIERQKQILNLLYELLETEGYTTEGLNQLIIECGIDE